MSAEKQETSLAVILKEHQAELKAIAPKYVNINRLMALAIEAKQRNPLLAQCSPVSVLNFCKKMAETGTDRVGAGGMWAVPFRNSKTGTYDMTPIPDWRLIVEKARRAKVIRHATAEAVYTNDEFDYEKGLEPRLHHKPAKGDRGDFYAVYCVYTLPDGNKDFSVMFETDIKAIRERSKAKDSGPWVTDYEEMAKKTVIKRALKIFEGASPELTRLIDTDNEAVGIDLLPEPIAEPKELPEPEAPEQPKEQAETRQGENKTEPVVSNPQPVGNNTLKPQEEGKEVDYHKFMDKESQRINEKAVAKKCSGCGRQLLCGTITGLCISCLRKKCGFQVK